MATYQIKTAVKNFTGTVVGVQITNGVGETDDPSIASYFERHDATVTCIKGDEPAFPNGDPSLEWTKDQLTAWADANKVDLTGAKTKADMLTAIQAGNKPATDGEATNQPAADDSAGDDQANSVGVDN